MEEETETQYMQGFGWTPSRMPVRGTGDPVRAEFDGANDQRDFTSGCIEKPINYREAFGLPYREVTNCIL